MLIASPTCWCPTMEDTDPHMDHLLTKLRRSMVELILQGDDVTRQMWQMYSIFEEIFGLQKISSKQKPVVVGDKLKQRAMALPPPSAVTEDNETNVQQLPSPSLPNTITTAPVTTIATSTATTIATTISPATPSTAPSVPSVVQPTSTTTLTITSSTDSNFQRLLPPSTPMDKKPVTKTKVNQRSNPPENNASSPPTDETPSVSPPNLAPAIRSSSSSEPQIILPRTSNPLLDTIGALAGSNPDSDDSDLDIVYQQLRYRGRHRRPEQVRMRAQRSHRHHHQQFASSDPESNSYAGSNSIDSGYKSQCATPEVSDTFSALEVRRSASDVSASDSSTTSGLPDSESKSAKIKMGTRSIVSKVPPGQSTRHSRYQQPPLLESSMNDVTLDHLMYLRQSLRKDRQEYVTSSSHSSIPSSSPSSTFRDELSPSTITDEDAASSDKALHHKVPQRQSPRLHHQQQQQQQQPYLHPTQTFTSIDSNFIPHGAHRTPPGVRSGRRLSAGNEVERHAMAANTSVSSDYLLSGMEFYDLDNVHDFPQRRSYVNMMEEKSRCSKIQLMTASKREMQQMERRVEPTFKKCKDPMRNPPPDPSAYGYQRRGSMEPPMPPQLHRSAGNPRGADSKLTEAAIRVLEMIEDFRMEEAIENASSPFGKMDARGRVRSNVTVTTVGPHAFVPRFRHYSGSRSVMRPASTGSLVSSGIPLDVRSVASAASSYAASAEHHVYEEIMYDLVCETSDQSLPPMGQDLETKPRNRLLPIRPTSGNIPRAYHQSPDHARITARSIKHRNNIQSIVTESDARNSERFVDMDWNVSRNRRDNMSSDFPA